MLEITVTNRSVDGGGCGATDGEKNKVTTAITAPLHLPITRHAAEREGPTYPPAPEELTLRAIQFQQACWDAGRPQRRDAAIGQGMFEGDFERQDAARMQAETAIRHPAEVEWIGVSARPGGEVWGLARHTYRKLLREPLAEENIPRMADAAAAKYTEGSMTQTSLRVRHFGCPHSAAVHTTQRETAFMKSPFSDASVRERAEAAARPFTPPIPPANAVLQSPLKKRMAEIRDESLRVAAPPSLTHEANNAPIVDAFVLAASVDPHRSWDPVKTPCGFRLLSCSTLDGAKWALSEQGSPYAYVQVALSNPPAFDWVRVNSGHVDPESVSGRVTKKVPLRSLLTISCGNESCVWGISEDSLDYGRCVARVGFTRDTPNGTDWVNMSEGIMNNPPSASDRAQSTMKRSSAFAPSTFSVESETANATVIKTFRHVSVGWDGSVWAIVLESLVDPKIVGQFPLSSVDAFRSSTPVRSSVWVREGARGHSLGHRWMPLSLSQEAFDFARPYEAAKDGQAYHFLQVHHGTFNNVLAIVAESPKEHTNRVGHLYERCGITAHNITGDCWRKILLDPTPTANGLLSLPVDLRLLPQPVHDAIQTTLVTLSMASDGGVWAVDSNRRLLDCSGCVARARANPSSLMIHDRFPGVQNHRDTSIDGDLFDANRVDLSPLIMEGCAAVDGQHISAPRRLSDASHRMVLSVCALLDLSSLRALFPDADTELFCKIPSPHHAVFLISVRPGRQSVISDTSAAPSSYELKLKWCAGAMAPIVLSIKTTSHVVFDELSLAIKVAQVAESVHWEWTPASPYVLPSVLPTSSCGTSRHHLLSFVVGANLPEQLDAVTPTLTPPLTSWLQFELDSLIPSAAIHHGVEFFESTVHRDICRDETAFEACDLADRSLRVFRQIQSRRTVLRTKLMLCGACRTVTVISSSPSLGAPTPAVAVLCDDFPWATENCCTLLSRDTQCPPLSTIIVPVASQPFLRRPDNFLFDEVIRRLSCPAASNSTNDHNDANGASSSQYYSTSSQSRLFTDILDHVDGSSRALQWRLRALALSNEAQLLFPNEHRLPTSQAVYQSRKDEDTRTRQHRVGKRDLAVFLRPGLSVIVECPLVGLLRDIHQSATRLFGVNEATAELFEHLLRKAFDHSMHPVETSGGTDSSENVLLLASNVSDALAGAAGQPVHSAARCTTYGTRSLCGFDLLASIQAQFDAVASGGQQPQRCVSLELLSPSLRIDVEPEPNAPVACFDAYDTRYHASGPCYTSPASSVVAYKRVVMECSVRFHVRPPPPSQSRGKSSGGCTVNMEEWCASVLPPSFVAHGEIVLFDSANTTQVGRSSNGLLTFAGKCSSIMNWRSPGGLGESVMLTAPSVEVIFGRSAAAGLAPAVLDASFELKTIRFNGQGYAHGNLFEFGSLEYPVMQGGPSKVSGANFMNAFGPCFLRVQRRVLPMSELIRGSSSDVAQRMSASMTRRGFFIANALDATGSRFLNAEYYSYGPLSMIHSTLPPNVRLPRQGAPTPEMPLPPTPLLNPADGDNGFLLSHQLVVLSPSSSNNDAYASSSQLRVLHFDESLDLRNEDGSVASPPALNISSTWTEARWLFVKHVNGATGNPQDIDSDGIQAYRSTLQDPILRHGDCVLLVDPDSGNCVGNGWEGSKNEAGYLWIVHRTETHSPQGDGCGAAAAVDGWAPIRHGDSITLLSAAPASVYDNLESLPAFLIPTAAGGAADDDTAGLHCFALNVNGVSSWVASATTAPRCATSLSSTACLVFGQPAVATAVAASPHLTSLDDKNQEVGSARIPFLNISGFFPHPLVFGDRPYGKGALVSLRDINDDNRGCAFEILCSQQQQQVEHEMVEEPVEPGGAAAPLQTATTEHQEPAIPSPPGESPTADNITGLLVPPLQQGGAPPTIRPQHTRRVVEHDVTFRLRDAAVAFLGAAMPCTGSSLNDGVAGVAMGDVVLHAVAKWRIPPTHSLVPPCAAGVSSETPAPRCMERQDSNRTHPQLCPRHGGSIDVHVALEVPLVRRSLLLNVPASSVGFPIPPCDGGDGFFHGDAALATPTLLGEVRCTHCVQFMESLIRCAINKKVENVLSRFDTDSLKAQQRRLTQEIELEEDAVNCAMENHTEALAPIEASASEEVKERLAELKDIIKRQSKLEEKMGAKPHKAVIYEGALLQLREMRCQTEKSIRAAEVVRKHQRALLCNDISAISDRGSKVSRLRAAAAEVSCQLRSAQRLSLASGVTPGSSSNPGRHVNAVETASAAAWALRSVRFHGNRNPASDASGPTASIELEFEVSPRAVGKLGAADAGYAQAVSSLSLLNPSQTIVTPTPQNFHYAETRKVGQQQQRVSEHAGTQTTDMLLLTLPFDVSDASELAAMPLKSMELFDSLVVNPIASRLVRDVLGSALQEGFGLTNEELTLIAGARPH